jgi:hypothetical protein
VVINSTNGVKNDVVGAVVGAGFDNKLEPWFAQRKRVLILDLKLV